MLTPKRLFAVLFFGLATAATASAIAFLVLMWIAAFDPGNSPQTIPAIAAFATAVLLGLASVVAFVWWDDTPVTERPPRLPRAMRREVKAEKQRLERDRIIAQLEKDNLP